MSWVDADMVVIALTHLSFSGLFALSVFDHHFLFDGVTPDSSDSISLFVPSGSVLKSELPPALVRYNARVMWEFGMRLNMSSPFISFL